MYTLFAVIIIQAIYFNLRFLGSYILMLEKPSVIQQQVRQIVNHPKNKQKVNDLILKMGRVLSKKRQLHQQQPVLVYENRMWIGNYSFANNKQFLAQNNIKHVLSCLQLSLVNYFPDISYKQFIVKDCQDSNFAKLVSDFSNLLAQAHGNVFVHCFSGVSRSAAFLISYIMMKEKLTYDDAYAKLKTNYPLAKPNNYFEQQLKSLQQTTLKEEENSNFDLLGHSQPRIKEDSSEKVQQTKNQEDLLNILSEVPRSPKKEESTKLSEQPADPKIQQKPISPTKSPVKNKKEEINLLEDFNFHNQARMNQNLIDGEVNEHQNKNEANTMEQSTTFSLEDEKSLLSLQNLTELRSNSEIDNNGLQTSKLLQKHQDLLELQQQTVQPIKQGETQHQQQKQEEKTHQVTNEQQEQKLIEKANFNQKKRKPKKKK